MISPTLFAEMTFGTGHNSIFIHDSAGTFTRTDLGLTGLPLLYPDAVQADLPPHLQLSGRFGNQANLNSSQSPFTNFNTTYDFLGNLTKVWGRHTSKVGVYAQKSLKDQTSFTNHNGVINFNENTQNPFDTSYAAANAAIGVFNSYHAGQRLLERRVPLLERRVVRAGQLEGQRPPDARLRPALLLGAAAARRGRPDVELLP